LNTLDQLDKKVEDTPLNEEEVDLKNCLNNRLAHMLREEEIKWYQHAKVKSSSNVTLILSTFICWPVVNIESLIFSNFRMGDI
jgi:hypothetical protein